MTPKAIFDLLVGCISVDAAPDSISAHAELVLVQQGVLTSGSDARIAVDKAGYRLKVLVLRLWNESDKHGQPTRFTLIETADGDLIMSGICHVSTGDTADEVAAKDRRRWSVSINEAILGNTSPTEFELLCGKVLGLIGVDKPRVSRAARDEGIDFFGQLNIVAEKFIFDVSATVEKQLNVWLVGQAKHYPEGQAGTPDLRHLFGSVQLARAGVFATDSFTSQQLKLRVADPVIFLFLTTGALSRDAWQICRKAGLVAMDGNMLCAFLADRGLGPTICDPTNYKTWLSSP